MAKRKTVIVAIILVLIVSAVGAAYLLRDSEIIPGNIFKSGIWGGEPDAELVTTVTSLSEDQLLAYRHDDILPGDSGVMGWHIRNEGNVPGKLDMRIFNVEGSLGSQINLDIYVNDTLVFENQSLSTGLWDLISSMNQGHYGVDILIAWTFNEDAGDAYRDRVVQYDIEFGLEQSNPDVTPKYHVESRFYVNGVNGHNEDDFYNWGEEVTLTAYATQNSTPFSHWERDGIIVSEERDYTFTVVNHMILKQIYEN